MTVKNSLRKDTTNKAKFSTFIASPAVQRKINDVVGGKNGTRFIASITSTVVNDPKLQECEPNSIITAAFLGEALNLSPSPQLGQYYFVPYKTKRGTVAQFQLGYKGYIQLAIRSGQYRKLNVISIKEGELIRYDPLNEEIEVRLIDDELVRESAKSVGYYAMFEYTNGFRKTMYWSKEKMEAHALKYSQGYAADKRKGTNWTFWSKDFDGMAYKTMLRQLISKWGIMSIDLQNAIDADMAVINSDGTKEYVDAPVTFVNEEAPQAHEEAPKAIEHESSAPKAPQQHEEADKVLEEAMVNTDFGDAEFGDFGEDFDYEQF